MIDITIAGETFRVDNFYEFSIAQSTLDLWHAGGQELATLILLFSGIWPYTKQLITLALWFPATISGFGLTAWAVLALVGYFG